jgi:hypothetical protein
MDALDFSKHLSVKSRRCCCHDGKKSDSFSSMKVTLCKSTVTSKYCNDATMCVMRLHFKNFLRCASTALGIYLECYNDKGLGRSEYKSIAR